MREGRAQEDGALSGNIPGLPACGPGERPGWHKSHRPESRVTGSLWPGAPASMGGSKPGIIPLLKVTSRYGVRMGDGRTSTVVIAVTLLLVLEPTMGFSVVGIGHET